MKQKMNKYLIRYTTESGDYEKEWVMANSAKEAEEKFKDDHWGWETITSVERI